MKGAQPWLWYLLHRTSLGYLSGTIKKTICRKCKADNQGGNPQFCYNGVTSLLSYDPTIISALPVAATGETKRISPNGQNHLW